MTLTATHPALARALEARDYSVLTAVQVAVLDANAVGRDLLVSAQTGSGKTVAFGLAMAGTLLGSEEAFPRAAEPLALIIAPTRELAMQVQRELTWLYANTGARVITCVGGMDARAEGRQLMDGAHIVVGTPGRLRDHLERRRLDLTKLKTIVLDEADEMLDLGFREDLEFILDATPAERQTLLFSATMPREIETLARRYQREAVRIETLRRNEQHADIDYQAIRVAPHDIEHAVVNVLRYHEMRATLVFCATRESVKRLHARLVERGFSAVALSGELTQHERTTALQALRDGRARVLVATDVAARGLDLPDLALVIHADLPNDGETLLHRSGRTGRAGRKGICTMVVPFNRRRKAEVLLNAAKLKVTWIAAPSADEIRARDQERFLADPIFTEAPSDEEQALAQSLQGARTSEEIALALVRMSRARLPAPEDLAEDTGPPPRREGGLSREFPRSDRFPRERDGGEDRGPRAPRGAHDDGREMVWFRLDIGRERNADPRWLLPLICKAGGISKAEVGAIKIFDRDTRFQIVAEFADKFTESVRENKPKDGHISRVGAHSPSDFAAVTEAIDAVAPQKTGELKSFERPARAYPEKDEGRKGSYPPRKPFDKKPFEKRSFEKKPFDRDRPAPAADGTERPRDKAPWQDRNKPGKKKPYTGAHFARKDGGEARRDAGDVPARGGASTHGAQKHGFKPSGYKGSNAPGWSKGSGGSGVTKVTRVFDGGKPASKYASKKKGRANPSSEK